MGTYNSKDEIDLNEMKKRKEKEKEKGNKIKNTNNGNVNNDSNNKNIPLKYPCYNTLRNTSMKDVKQHIFTNIFIHSSIYFFF